MKLDLPKVQSRKPKDDDASFPLKHYSYSTFVKFCTNPILFKINYLNGDRFDTAMNASAILGQAFHKAMEVYYGGTDDVAITNEQEAIEYGMKAGMEFIELYNENYINYQSTIPNKQKIFDKFTFAFNSYVQEMPYGKNELISVEELLEEHVDIEWRGKRLALPIKLKGYSDKIIREDGKLKIVDYKTAYAFSNPEKIDGGKILQAVFYYLLVFAKYGEAPYSMIFEEVKHTKNSDGRKQVQQYEVVFEENQQFFDFFFRLYDDVTRAIQGEMVYVPNIQAMFENELAMVSYIHRLDVNEELAEQMKKQKVDNITDLLKAKLQNAANMEKLMKTVEKQFVSAKNLNYSTMKNEEKIKVKMMEYGMMLEFDSKIEGNTVDLYRYTPAIGLKMSRIESFVADVEQVLGVADIRVLAPIPDTTMVGFEVPRANRTFPTLKKIPTGTNVAIGVDVMGKEFHFDMKQAPHVLIAGATGSGKSVCMSSLITQLGKAPKKDVELHLFDPKIVELAPHQDDKNVVEYASDTMDIYHGLKNLVNEMNDRYKTLSKAKVRSIEQYDGNMPYKFVFIDEFGDLILQNHVDVKHIDTGEVYLSGPRKGQAKTEKDETHISKEIEKMILVLAQKSRAAGIHLVIATQRPSVDIVTGSIKANFPTKIAFRTAKATDSKVILDEAGAEKLKGKGDCIFSSQDGDVRLQAFNLE